MKSLFLIVFVFYNSFIFAGNSGGFGFPSTEMTFEYDDEGNNQEAMYLAGNSGGFGFSENKKVALFLDSFNNLNKIHQETDRLEVISEKDLIHFEEKLFFIERSLDLGEWGLSSDEILKIEEMINL